MFMFLIKLDDHFQGLVWLRKRLRCPLNYGTQREWLVPFFLSFSKMLQANRPFLG